MSTDKTVTLWHGTTASAAASVAEQGFRAFDPLATVAATAARFGLETQPVTEWLEERGRFVVAIGGRNDRVWFASSRAAAERWASRAPEAVWESLWAVWCVLEERTDEWTPWAIPDAASWHLRQMLDDEPAVIEVTVNPLDLPRPEGRRGPTGSRTSQVDALVASIEAGRRPEVEMPVPMEVGCVVGWNVIDRHVPRAAVAGLLGVQVDGLASLVDEGRLPQWHGGTDAHPPHWLLSQLAPYVRL